MLALNMTVALGTLNGIFFYAHIIVSANVDTYLLLVTPDFTTIFISWLNLDIGFDVCYYVNSNDLYQLYKALLQLVFPSYVIFLVIIVIVASECSFKFSKNHHQKGRKHRNSEGVYWHADKPRSSFRATCGCLRGSGHMLLQKSSDFRCSEVHSEASQVL